MQFLYMSLGSLSELETQYDICVRLNYINLEKDFTNRISYINSMLTGLIRSLKRKA
ncbi:MAG: four helix bundle protein [Candidatus Brocadiales bacterium]|nr:four helix bundle protein [Candidatus Brocadiales bacterium]